MSFIYQMADTWNAIGTTFNSILMNVSDGAGGSPVGSASSLIINMQKNGATVFGVDVNGNVALPNNTAYKMADSGGTSRTIITLDASNQLKINNNALGTGGKIILGPQAGGLASLTLDNLGNVALFTASLTTSATDGFFYITTCAGQPTGVPTAFTGRIPMVYDSTNHQFWFYDGGAWKQPKTPAGAATVTWQ